MLQKFWQEKISAEELNVLKSKVNNLRDVIEVWWERCFTSEYKKQQFEDYKSTNYTTELYNQHKEKLNKLKRKFYRNE
jgi:hypothetical protein